MHKQKTHHHFEVLNVGYFQSELEIEENWTQLPPTALTMKRQLSGASRSGQMFEDISIISNHVLSFQHYIK